MEKIAIATLSYARNLKEKKDIIQTLTYLNKYGYPVIVANESDSKFSINREVKNLKNVKLHHTRGFGKRILISLKEAAKIGDYILYLEGDKKDFAKNQIEKLIAEYLKNPKGMLLPARNKASFEKYPKFQQEIEKSINQMMAAVLKMPGDYCYGPRIFEVQLVEYLNGKNTKLNFGFQSFLTAVNCRLKLPLRFKYLQLSVPPDILENDQLTIYRLQTLEWYVKGVIEAFKIKL